MSVTIVDTAELDWQDVPDSWPGKVTGGESPVHFKYFGTGMPSLPAGQLVRYAAGHTEARHSHDEDEVFVILEGDLFIDGTELAPGDLAFISGGSLYSPRTEHGCLYLRLGLAVDE